MDNWEQNQLIAAEENPMWRIQLSRERPVGLPFSQVYLKSDELVDDSERFRKRLSMAVHHISLESKGYRDLGRYLEGKLGVDGPVFTTTPLHDWKKFYLRLEIRDVLDSITRIHEYFARQTDAVEKVLGKQFSSSQTHVALRSFRATIQEIFAEEPIGYELDEEFGVHFRVDTAFSLEKQSAIKGLSGKQYGPAREYIEKIDDCLMQSPADGTGAIRNVFFAVENVGNQLLGTRQFDGKAINALKNLLAVKYQDGLDDHLKAANATMAQSFGSWVSACHNYRHEKGTEKPHRPPEDLAILLVNQGFGYVRWLAALNN